MRKSIQAVRGMHDLLPEEARLLRHVEETAREVLEGYGYEEIRLPVVERTELFRRTLGEATDIVEKEMYTFDDHGESLSLRPEGTAGCVRAAIEHGLCFRQVRRLWYRGPMFRHERPQKGRYRQFHQVGAEAFGLAGPELDAELILLTVRLWRRLGLDPERDLELQLNTLGTPEERAAYRERLVAYLERRREELDPDSLRRLRTNPLRILDSKHPAMRPVIEAAPRLLDHLGEASRERFRRLCALLDLAGVPHRVAPCLVRGLDYYTHTVFEWVTHRLGAQGTVCAGGRYDGLVGQLGGHETPAAGFALGLERVAALLQELGRVPEAAVPHAFLVMAGEAALEAGLAWGERLREACPWLRLVQGGEGSLRAQLRRADRSGARYALILGEEEAARGTVSLKPLREELPQRSWERDLVLERLAREGEGAWEALAAGAPGAGA